MKQAPASNETLDKLQRDAFDYFLKETNPAIRRAICDCGRKCNILYKLKLIHYVGLGFLGAIN